ncbi:MAG: RagB/SusD family nutrient uptake outer membrane protein, partial [Phocaeicola sp.]
GPILRAEARFLRALYYYYAMDLFGNIPFITELSDKNPPQATRKEIFEFIEKELVGYGSEAGCLEAMKEPRTNTYGRVDKAAGWLLLARLYLNAEVYTGTPQWEKAVENAAKVIASPYKLSTEYRNLFMGDNNENGAQNEVLLPILQDGVDTQNYGGTFFLIASTRSEDMGESNTSENWAGNRARHDMMKKFFPNGTAPEKNENEMIAAAQDKRALFFGEKRKIAVDTVSIFTNGYSCAKFTNLRTDGEKGKDNKFVDMDFPLMRLAEAYLTLAEAKTRLGKLGEATSAIDALRTRAGANKKDQYTLDDICDEWSREFAFEGRRRMDLIRFDKFGGNNNYMWEWKGGIKEGTNFNKTKNIYAIPTREIEANSNLTQNPGY